MSLVIVANSVSSARATFQSFHRGDQRKRGFRFLRREGLGLSHMTARHWVEMFQSKAVSLKKFVMRKPKRENECCCRELLSFVSMLLG